MGAFSDRSTEGVRAIVDAHYGAMHRFARSAGTAPGHVKAVVRNALSRAYASSHAVETDPPRVKLLECVLDELREPTSAPPEGPSVDQRQFESDNDRWAGHWKNEYPLEVSPEVARIGRALTRLEPTVAVVLLLRDVEALPPATVRSLLGLSDEVQRVFLQHGRVALRQILQDDEGAAS